MVRFLNLQGLMAKAQCQSSVPGCHLPSTVTTHAPIAHNWGLKPHAIGFLKLKARAPGKQSKQPDENLRAWQSWRVFLRALHVLAQLCFCSPPSSIVYFPVPKKELVMRMPLFPGFQQLAVDALAPQKVSCLLCATSWNPVSRAQTWECSASNARGQKIKKRQALSFNPPITLHSLCQWAIHHSFVQRLGVPI